MKETRRLLLSAARNLLDENGLAGFSMRPLGKQCGLSRSAIYRHFRSKEDLLAELTKENFLQLYQFFIQAEKKLHSIDELLFKCIEQIYFLGVKYPVHYSMMFSYLWDKTKYQKVKEQQKIMENFLLNILKKHPGLSEFDEEKIQEIFLIVLSFIHGLTDLSIADNLFVELDRDAVGRHIKRFLSQMLQG